MLKISKSIMFSYLLGIFTLAASSVQPVAAADLDYGKPGEPVNLVVGYQPYYTESWSGVVINGKQLWKKYLPPGSTVEFQVGLQGAIIVNQMLAGKQHIGYMGDMPAIVATTKRDVADIRMVANIGLSRDQCNILLARNDAPAFKTQEEAIKWMDGKVVAAPKGSCSDRFAQEMFKKYNVKPEAYLNQSIEVITSGFRVGKLDAAIIWEPTASRIVQEKLARRVASGNAVGEDDGAFLDMRYDLIRQRPDVVKAWLKAEIEAEKFLADPKNADEVVAMVKQQTTGFPEEALRTALYGPYPESVGGSVTRVVLPAAFTDTAYQLLSKATAFLYDIKSINVDKLLPDAILPNYVQQAMTEMKVTAPVGTVRIPGAPAADAPKAKK